MDEKRPAVLLVGPPGAGKETQAKMLASLGFVHLSTGDLIRQYQPDVSTPLGRRVLQSKATDAIIPDEDIAQILDEYVAGQSFPLDARYLLDGYPYTESQVPYVNARFDVSQALYLKSNDDEVLVQRIVNRGARPADMDAERVRQRVENFYKITCPALAHYTNVKSIDATGTVAKQRSIIEVHQDILKVLDY